MRQLLIPRGQTPGEGRGPQKQKYPRQRGNETVLGIRYDLDIFIYVVTRFKIAKHIACYLCNFKFQPFLFQVLFFFFITSGTELWWTQSGTNMVAPIVS